MEYALFAGAIVVLALAAMIASITPHYPRSSRFELERRRKKNDATAVLQLKRQEYYGYLLSLQQFALITLLAVFALGYGFTARADAIIHVVVVILLFPFFARFMPLKKFAMKQYDAREQRIITWLSRHVSFRKYIHPNVIMHESAVESREELEHLIMSTHEVINHDEKSMLLAGLDANNKKVVDCMTPRDQVHTVNHDELLGPLVLDDLHKSGHSQFPVIGKDIDHIVGMLYVPKLLRLEAKRSVTAMSAMDHHIEYIAPETTLDQALQQILHSRQTLMVVVDAKKRTLGVVTIRDIVEALIGRNLSINS